MLGVDAGSTTTKAVLIDPGTRDAVAWHYRRTNGDPLGATRHCLLALVEQAGNRRVGLVGTTGSARELIGVYLDTPHVYNEILAHAAGAAHFDSEVEHDLRDRRAGLEVHPLAQRRGDRLRHERRLFGGHRFVSRRSAPTASWAWR